MQKYLAGLSAVQASAVLGVFVFTLVGALALAWGFRWWNKRQLRG